MTCAYPLRHATHYFAYGCSPEVESRAFAAITTYGYSPEVESHGGVNNRGVSNGGINNRGVGNRGVSNGGVNNRGVINRTCD